MDETDHQAQRGRVFSLSRAVDQTGQTIDCLLTKPRNARAATRFLTKAIRRHSVPAKSPLDGKAAHKAAIERYNDVHGTTIAIRQSKYLHNIVDQDHRGVQRVTRPMLGCKAFHAARRTLLGRERMHMIKK